MLLDRLDSAVRVPQPLGDVHLEELADEIALVLGVIL
jgi:hypothetical protein